MSVHGARWHLALGLLGAFALFGGIMDLVEGSGPPARSVLVGLAGAVVLILAVRRQYKWVKGNPGAFTKASFTEDVDKNDG